MTESINLTLSEYFSYLESNWHDNQKTASIPKSITPGSYGLFDKEILCLNCKNSSSTILGTPELIIRRNIRNYMTEFQIESDNPDNSIPICRDCKYPLSGVTIHSGKLEITNKDLIRKKAHYKKNKRSSYFGG